MYDYITHSYLYSVVNICSVFLISFVNYWVATEALTLWLHRYVLFIFLIPAYKDDTSDFKDYRKVSAFLHH